MSVEVAMLDLLDLTLHRPSNTHLVSLCGLYMDHCQVGPLPPLLQRSQRVCTSCYDTGVPDL